MPATNPFTHLAGEGRAYVTGTAGEGGEEFEQAYMVPIHLAVLLVVAAGGLYALNKAGFRFVATVGGGVG